MICRPVFAALALASCLAGIPAALAQKPADFPARATAYVDRPAIAVGVAWYPEQWPESRWDTDLALMKATGFNTVRLGEFAWSRMEREEGKFDFTWLDRAIAAAERHGFMVVLGRSEEHTSELQSLMRTSIA